MAAPKGNTYYTLRKTIGRHLIFKTPESFERHCNEYFIWCQENPILEEQIFSTKMGIQREEVSKVRAFTVGGLCMFLGISKQTLEDYGKREVFVDTFTRVKEIIYNQKFENAAAGMLNPQFIGKDIGLVDKKEDTVIIEPAKIKWGNDEVEI